MSNFKIFRSSAGSGKTYTLTREYLKLALSSPRLGQEVVRDDYFCRILAITFTNDAAKEMRDRIVSELDKLANAEPDSDKLHELFKEIHQEYPDSIETIAELKNRCQNVLKAILHNYSDFAVLTIDSFISRLSQSFKRDLGLPYNYELELELDSAINTAVEELLMLAGRPEHKDLTKWLIRFLRNQLDEGKTWDIKKSVVHTAKALFDEKKAELVEAIKSIDIQEFGAFEIHIQSLKAEFKKQIIALASTGLEKIAQSGLVAEDFKSKSIYLYFEKHKDFDNRNTATATLQQQADERDFSKQTSPKRLLVQQISPELAEIFERIEKLKREKEGQYILLDELSKHIYQFGLLRMIWELLEQRNFQQERVQLADLHKRIAQVVENEPVPFIYERLGERFYHIMIDEFQDTSLLQWQNLLVLVCNALSHGTVSLVVGDAKQAIYRWRGGRASMLIDLPEIPFTTNIQKKQNAQIMVQEANSQVLGRNFRSAPDIVEFNNAFFDFLRSQYAQDYPLLVDYYKNPTQKPVKTGRGSVHVEECEEHVQRSGEVVGQWIKQGVPLQDIAILCNTNLQAVALSKHLLGLGINVVTAESLKVNQSPSVRLLVSMLKVLDNPTDAENKGYFLLQLKAMRQTDIDDQILAQAAQRSSIYRIFELLRNHFFIDINEKELFFLPLFQKIIELVRLLGLPYNQGEQPFIQKFIDYALEFSEKKSQSLSDFLADFQSNEKLSINLSQGVEAVKVMTIHKSKGLQFPFVLIPFAHWKLYKVNQEVWAKWPDSPIETFPYAILKVNKSFEETALGNLLREEKNQEIIEQINKLYVAMTRAEVAMHILYKKPQKGNVAQLLSDFCLHKGSNFFGVEQPTFEPSGLAQSDVFEAFQYRPLKDFGVRLDTAPIDEHLAFTERERGEIVHALMERINSPQDVVEVFAHISTTKLNRDDCQRLIHNLKAIFSQEQVLECYSDKALILNESEIIYKENGITKILRPDRVVLLEDKIVVIDYKTGNKRKEYQAQVNTYARFLEPIYLKKARKMIFYLDLGEVEIWD